ncbi:response regulator [Desulfobacterales bacterium HSG2]|nr:response regulator [Desulfobacterales bacterium HSG2]
MSKAQILVVEDDGIVALDITNRLKKLGYSVPCTCIYGKQAIERAEALRPDLVVMDIVLKGEMDGIEAAEIISSRFCIPIIFLTAYADQEKTDRAKKVMPYGYILKPFRDRDIKNAIEIALYTAEVNAERRRAEQELAELNRSLEEKVRERTAELQGTAKALEASRSGFRSVVDKNASGIMVVDEKGIIQFVNPAMQSLFRHYELSPGNEFALLSGADGRTEVRITRSENEIGIAEMEVIDTAWENDPARLLMLHDITDLKKAQAELEEERASLAERVEERTAELSRTNAELARANRLKDEFLANMSHELRTPLTAVLGMSEALTEQVYGPLNEKQVRSLQGIESSGRHLLSLINDILDLSKISAGKMELEIGRVSVEAVCQSGMKMIKQIALKKNQKLSLITDSGPGHIRADMLRLKQMLVNLLMNAVKFTPKRGEISLEVTCVPERDTVEFAVRDTGVGISRENMEKLFKPFVQLDGGLSREHEGTGLGLVMVSKLAEMHGGSVSVESEEGKYSRFTIMLPWYPEEEEEEKEDLRGFENLVGLDKVGLDVGLDKGTARILMADDNMANIETVADYLKAKSYSVLLAYDGSEAVALTIEKKPDLILMDIQMPGMNGLEAIKAIRKLEKDEGSGIRRTPIIALTALAMPGDREQCIEAGADKYMSKPVGLKQLSGMIEELLAV